MRERKPVPRPPRNDRWLPYVLVGGCALLALTIAAVGTLTLVRMGRDTPPDQLTRTQQPTGLLEAPTVAPIAATATVPLAQTTPLLVGSPRPTSASELTPRPAAATTSTTGSSAPQRSSVTNYTVAAGDTLGRIATQFGVSVPTILAFNKLPTGDLLKVGQVLRIPAVDGVLHEVQPGETVNAIARLYGVSADEIGKQNGLDSSFAIKVGESLLIPGATRPLATAARPASTPTKPAATTAPTSATRASPTPTRPPAASPTSASKPGATATRVPSQATATPQRQATPAMQPSPTPVQR